MATASKWLFVLLLAALPVALMLWLPAGDGRPVADPAGASTAIGIAKQMILQSTRSPETAVFPPDREFTVESLGIDRWRVAGWVEAESAIDTRVRIPWTIEIAREGDRWKLVDREQDRGPLSKAVSEGSWTNRLKKQK